MFYVRSLGLLKKGIGVKVARVPAGSPQESESMAYALSQQWKTVPIRGEPYLSVVIPASNGEMRINPTKWNNLRGVYVSA